MKELSPDTRPPIILITTVDIGGGLSDTIELRKGEDPTVAARTFCEKHGLPSHIVGHLTQHILDNLSRAKLEEQRKVGAGAGMQARARAPASMRAAHAPHASAV